MAVDYAEVDERALVDFARQDANAFAELYRRHVDQIYRFALRRTGSMQIAEDVTSATFEKALRGLVSYRWREPGLGPWLFRIASNELVNHHRKEGRQAKLTESIKGSRLHPLEVEAEVYDDYRELRRALDALRPRYQRALSLRYLADLTNEEAAAAMGVSRSTMAVLLHRSSAALRRAFADQNPKEAGR